MASTFIIMGNKLKLMIEQTKIHAEALKDSAVTQAKIQAENEKAEVSLLDKMKLHLNPKYNVFNF